MSISFRNQEIISAQLNKDNTLLRETIVLFKELDYKSELVDNNENDDIYKLLSIIIIPDFDVTHFSEIDKNLYYSIKELVQGYNFLRSFIIKPLYKYTEPCPKLDCKEVNGCTSSPDAGFCGLSVVNWKSCCDSHDNCYCRGGDEGDRTECDRKLRSCMTELGCPIWGEIYYRAVQRWGNTHFNYCDDTSIIVVTPETNKCYFSATLQRVRYKGKNIGNDIKYKVGIRLYDSSMNSLQYDSYTNGNKFKHGKTKYPNVRIIDRKLECQEDYVIGIHIEIVEDDILQDDKGDKTSIFNYYCPAIEIRDYSVYIPEKQLIGGKKTARFEFKFEFRGICSQ
jgi:hypothetical protein